MTRKQPTAKLGQSICQCASCGETFSTTAAFDGHRVGEYRVGRYCLTLPSPGWRKRIFKTGWAWTNAPEMTEEQKRGLKNDHS